MPTVHQTVFFFDLGDYVRYKTTAAATQTAAGLLEQVYAALTEVVVYEASTPFSSTSRSVAIAG